MATISACAAEDVPMPPPPPELSAASLRSAVYASQHVEEGEIRLVQGAYRDTARRVSVFFLPEYAVGDIDSDGAPDAAVVLATTTGGSGTFLDLALVLNRDGQPVNAATRFLGDRVPVDRIRIVEGEVQVDLTMHGPADPMCCPSLEVTRRFRYESAEVVEIGTRADSADDTP
ncbi:MAG: LppP/LprE family lipoprotein [marine benthic group bacterium]|nr:LppP/LprE family lipoprotein [Gemmatimonadota bacterium]